MNPLDRLKKEIVEWWWGFIFRKVFKAERLLESWMKRWNAKSMKYQGENISFRVARKDTEWWKE